MSQLPLEGRVAVVTGGGRGIGASTAAHLAKRGARVVVAARTESDLLQIARYVVDNGGEAMPVICDVSDSTHVERLFAEADERFGPVDVLVNNAGLLTVSPMAELDEVDWERMIAVNLTGTYLCSKQALARMIPRRTGVIINVASVGGISGVEKFPGLVAYAAAKGGVIQLSEALAAEVKPHGIRVVAVSPGAVNTKMLQKAAPDLAPQAMTPGKVAQVIAFLATDEAEAMTGVNVPVWGMPAPPKAE